MPQARPQAEPSALETLFTDVFSGDGLIRAVISGKRKKSLPFQKVTVRPVSLSSGARFQLTYTYPNKVTHENLTGREAAAAAFRLMTEDLKQADIFTAGEDIQVLAAKPDKPRILRRKATKQADAAVLTHDQTKRYVIPDGVPCDFLIRLGVMDAQGKVFPRAYNKFRQINRYLEIIEDVYPYLAGETGGAAGTAAGAAGEHGGTAGESAASPAATDAGPASERPLRIIDFGCGKAYLTFAIYYYLHVLKGRPVEIIGLDLKEDVIRFCEEVARDLKYDGLHFERGDIADYESSGADMVVTLHACDTATDYALAHAVAWHSRVILSVPCCQHELFSQIKNELHQPMLKHGILKDRLTEYLTDGLRGLKLEAYGYDVAMIEFTSLEHTARNIMIKAVRPARADLLASKKAAHAEKEFQALCDFYRVTPVIGTLLPPKSPAST